jgi:hypothetical protein
MLLHGVPRLLTFFGQRTVKNRRGLRTFHQLSESLLFRRPKDRSSDAIWTTAGLMFFVLEL